MVKKTSNFSTKIEPDLIKHIAKELETTFIKTIHAQFNKILSSDSGGTTRVSIAKFGIKINTN